MIGLCIECDMVRCEFLPEGFSHGHIYIEYLYEYLCIGNTFKKGRTDIGEIRSRGPNEFRSVNEHGLWSRILSRDTTILSHF